jgi:hypothetical protein
MADWLARPARIAAQMLSPTTPAASPDGAPPQPVQPTRAFFDRNDPARHLAHLPASLEKFRSIADTAQSCLLLSRAVGDEIEEYRAQESRYDARISELRNPRRGMDNTTALKEAETNLASVRERLARARGRMARTGYAEAAPLAKALSDYLENECRHTTLKAYEGLPPAKLLKGESPTDGVERCRRVVADVVGKIEHLDTIGIPAEEAYRIGCAEIDGLAREGAPSIVGLLQFGGKIGWPESSSWAMGLDPKALILPSPQIQALALAAWHGADSMKVALRAAIEKSADKDAMMPAQKAEQRAALLLIKLQMERAEEAVIESMPVPIARRLDADPRAILLLDDSAPAPAS